MSAFSIKPRDLFCIAIFIAVCGLAAQSAAPPVSPKPPLAPAPDSKLEAPPSQDVAVTVNGVKITEPQVQALAEPELRQLAAGGTPLPPQMLEQVKLQIRQQALDRLIVEQLMDEQVKKANISVSEQDVIDHLTESGAQSNPPMSLEQIKALIESQGRPFDQVVKQIQADRNMKYQKLIKAYFVGRIDINERDVNNYYFANPKIFQTAEQVRASHILIQPDDNDPNIDPNRAMAAAKAKAEDLLKKIKAGGDFAELAKANSACQSAEKGGDLGFFTKTGKDSIGPPEFGNAAFALKVNQVGDILETDYGYHIIKVTDRKDPNLIPFEQARDEIKRTLTQHRQRELVREYIESLKAAAKIVYPPGKEPPKPGPLSERPGPPPESREKPLGR